MLFRHTLPKHSSSVFWNKLCYQHRFCAYGSACLYTVLKSRSRLCSLILLCSRLAWLCQSLSEILFVTLSLCEIILIFTHSRSLKLLSPFNTRPQQSARSHLSNIARGGHKWQKTDATSHRCRTPQLPFCLQRTHTYALVQSTRFSFRSRYQPGYFVFLAFFRLQQLFVSQSVKEVDSVKEVYFVETRQFCGTERFRNAGELLQNRVYLCNVQSTGENKINAWSWAEYNSRLALIKIKNLF